MNTAVCFKIAFYFNICDWYVSGEVSYKDLKKSTKHEE